MKTIYFSPKMAVKCFFAHRGYAMSGPSFDQSNRTENLSVEESEDL